MQQRTTTRGRCLVSQKKCFEDFDEDFTFHFQVPGLGEKEIVEFASTYDPQRFHLDPDEAARTHFGALVASGFQTQLLCFQPFCREVLVNTHAIGAPGIDELKWRRPWFPGEAVAGTVKLVGKRPSSRRSDRGYLDFLLEASVDDEPLFSMSWTVIMLTRSGADGAARDGATVAST